VGEKNALSAEGMKKEEDKKKGRRKYRRWIEVVTRVGRSIGHGTNDGLAQRPDRELLPYQTVEPWATLSTEY
jgi:hypothetical protein